MVGQFHGIFFLLMKPNFFSWNCITSFSKMCVISDGLGTQNTGFGSSVEKWVDGRMGIRSISSFFALFQDFSKLVLLWNIEKSYNLCQKGRKCFVQPAIIALNPYFGWFYCRYLISHSLALRIRKIVQWQEIWNQLFYPFLFLGILHMIYWSEKINWLISNENR